MKKSMIKSVKWLLSAFIVGACAGCNTDPEYYSEVVPDTFYTSETAVWQRYCRPFTIWKEYVATTFPRFELMELGTDEMCIPTRGADWDANGRFRNLHHHKFEGHEQIIYNGFNDIGWATALAWDVLRDIRTRVDLEKTGLTQEKIDLMTAQLKILIANLLKDGLDLFGGMPIYEMDDTEIKPRSTDVETFEYIERLIKENIDLIPAKETLGATETTYIHKAWAAVQLAQLYFNAEPYTKGKKSMFEECAKICEDIIDGKYGAYELATDWRDIFSYGNETCPEIIYGIPSDATYSETESGLHKRWLHYNTNQYLGGTSYGKNNGYGVSPSCRPDGTPYTEADFKLGRVMQKFEDTDVRKQPYCYEGNGEYTGMFLMGYQVSPSSHNTDGSWRSMGNREYKKRVIYLNDCVARFNLDGGVYDWSPDGKPLDKAGAEIDRSTLGSLSSTIFDGEESSLYRLIKRQPPVDILEYNDLRMRYPAMTPISRLTEVYYMLAECYLRGAKGNKGGSKARAAELINQVRRRNFVDGNDPNPVTAENLDKYRMLDEWMIEFLGEARRRTDLIRWDAYVTEKWWDHEPSNNDNWNRFPIPDKAVAGNNLLEPNPGYPDPR